MDQLTFDRVGERMYREKLENGLTVCVFPKPEFQKGYAFFATNYGGMDVRFCLDGVWTDSPAGVAHYLEHKMFDTKEGNALQLMDVVGVDDTMLDDIHDRDSALRLHQIIRERLTTREAEIIRLRYGLGGTIPLTQREIAASFGISRSYVSRIEKRALEKLRQELQDGPAPQLVRRRPHSSGT